ncbi:MAG TPA: DegT/DnrJ/EryC1/StrS family aminotransferase, partial [Candidatus Glassbacteria bacterium]|nr:DegT/DnrJ/EryC1/StrS family aminotransferase [Candidatus Glassbacteria bacterium]
PPRHAGLADKIRLLRHHGMDRPAVQRYGKDDVSYEIAEMGWKYNMSNIQAALLHGQLERAWRLNARRLRLQKFYRARLAGVPGITLLPEIPDSRHAVHVFTIHVPADMRNRFLNDLRQRGIGVAINYKPIHLLKFFREKFGLGDGDFPVAEAIGASTITLPLYPKLTNAEAAQVVQAVRETAEKLGF